MFDNENEEKTINIPDEAVVTPWNVVGKIDYIKLIEKFGTELIDTELIKRFEKVTGKEAHPWIKRGIFFSHRSLNNFLDAYENGDPIFLYTGRGPTSESLHVGHMIPFLFTLYLQQTFDCPLIIQIADDEKYYFKQMDFTDVYRLGFENAKDIIAFGFDVEKTFIFSNRDYRLNTESYEEFASTVSKFVTQKTIQKIFGFDELATLGMYMWPVYQSIAAFSKSFPHIFGSKPAYCLVAYAIDQDPYFRLARDIAEKMNLLKPCSIMSTFLDPLTGGGKMSSSNGENTALFLTDDYETIKNKIMKYALSGSRGNGSLEEHKLLGGDPNIDISCNYLKYFELDESIYQKICNDFSLGLLSCYDVKMKMLEKLWLLIKNHQEKRLLVTDEILNEFYSMKKMNISNGNKKIYEIMPNEKILYDKLVELNIDYLTTYHMPVTTMAEGEEIMKRLEGIVCKNILLEGTINNVKEYYLYITRESSKVNLKELSQSVGAKFKFADRDKLQSLLNVPRGCATIFGLINNKQHNIKVLIDKEINNCKVNFHPLRNDATTTISYESMLLFIKEMNNPLLIV